jgi:hypothetical protein
MIWASAHRAATVLMPASRALVRGASEISWAISEEKDHG